MWTTNPNGFTLPGTFVPNRVAQRTWEMRYDFEDGRWNFYLGRDIPYRIGAAIERNCEQAAWLGRQVELVAAGDLRRGQGEAQLPRLQIDVDDIAVTHGGYRACLRRLRFHSFHGLRRLVGGNLFQLVGLDLVEDRVAVLKPSGLARVGVAASRSFRSTA